MSDPFDDARDALSGAEPTTDLWAEASRRAASGDVVSLAPAAHPHRRGRWLAVAAAVALVAGTVGVLSMSDDSTVDTTPTDASDDPTIYQGDDGCSFGITGDPLTPRQFGPAERPVTGTHFVIGDLMARVNVPAGPDLVFEGAPWVPATLRRGEATQTSPDDQSTRIAWQTGGAPSCDTFSVSVSGGDPDVTEPAAIALADRIVLQSELPSNAVRCEVHLPVDLTPGLSPAFADTSNATAASTTHGTWTDGAPFEVSAPAVTEITGPEVADVVELDRGSAVVFSSRDLVTDVQYVPDGAGGCMTFSVTAADLGAYSSEGFDPEVSTAVAIANAVEVIAVPVGEHDPDPTLFQLGDCAFGVAGDPVVEVTDGDQAPRLDGPPSVRLGLGATQNALVHVPGYMVTDLVGERIEEVELARGTASVWFTSDFVQVRWFPGTEEPCDSFTVTVGGTVPDQTTEDSNRHVAVDLAERILLPDVRDDPTDPADPVEQLEGEWTLDTSFIDGAETDGNGVTFTFLDGEADWTDGCNSFSAPYAATGDTTFRMGAALRTYAGCPTNPTSQAVQQVMSADEIEADLGVGLGSAYLRLTAGNAELLLRDPLLENTPETTTSIADAAAAGIDDAASLIGTAWVVVDITGDQGRVSLPEPLTVRFGASWIAWEHECLSVTDSVAFVGRALDLGGNPVSPTVACDGSETLSFTPIAGEFFGADGSIDVEIDSDGVRLAYGDATAVLRPE